jgi:transcriptional regulator with XRE-family HTH domain
MSEGLRVMKLIWRLSMKLDASLLKGRRTELSMTQEILAKKTGYDVRTIQRAEAGKSIQSNVAASIAQVLDVPVDRLKESQVKSSAGQQLGQGLGAVDLVECRSGRVLLQQLRGCHFLEVEYDFEARSEHRDTLKRLGASLRANKSETIEWLKFTLEGVGERTHGYAFEDTAF